MKRANWLIVATLASMMFVQPNKANAFNNDFILNGTYRGGGTGTFYDLSATPSKFNYVSTNTFTYDGNGHTVQTFIYTIEGASSSSQLGPCTDTATGTYQVNQDGTGTSAYTITDSTGSNCTDKGGTYTNAFTTDGTHVYRILTSDSLFAAFSISGTSLKDGFNNF